MVTEAMDPHVNRRIAERTEHTVPVKLSYRSTSDFIRAYSKDVSLHGVSLVTSKPLSVGTEVDLSIELQPGKGLRITAEVVWCKEAHARGRSTLGLRFTDMPDRSRHWLAKMMGGPL